MSSNGSRPAHLRSRRPLSRRMRLLLGGLAAVVIAGSLVTPVVLHGGGSGGSCTRTLSYRGRRYVARSVPRSAFVEAIAIGVGVARGCGSTAANVDLRSLTGVRTANAVGVTGDAPAIYVRAGVCPGVAAGRLASCLRRSG